MVGKWVLVIGQGKFFKATLLEIKLIISDLSIWVYLLNGFRTHMGRGVIKQRHPVNPNIHVKVKITILRFFGIFFSSHLSSLKTFTKLSDHCELGTQVKCFVFSLKYTWMALRHSVQGQRQPKWARVPTNIRHFLAMNTFNPRVYKGLCRSYVYMGMRVHIRVYTQYHRHAHIPRANTPK